MNLPKISDAPVAGKRVLVRADLDVPFDNGVIRDFSRIVNCVETFREILTKGAQNLVICGHLGKYEGSEKTVSTSILKDKISELLGVNVSFVEGMPPEGINGHGVFLLDNVRLNPAEEENDPDFAKAMASLGDVYVNEAFATSHRVHASIVGIPTYLPHYAGLRFYTEIEKLSTILENPKRPVVAIISGIKKDKLDYIESFKKIADKILVGGKLPDYLGDNFSDPKVIPAKLNPDREDLTIRSIENFEDEISKAGTIVLAGVVGKYEDEGQSLGTKRVFTKIAESQAFKIVGGGDSSAALSLFGLTEKFDWVSTGGGAMLEFLAKRTLPGIEALVG